MFSLRNHFADAQVCELGGELIDTGHARIRALAAELGLVLDDLSQDPTASAATSGSRTAGATASAKSSPNTQHWPRRSSAIRRRCRTRRSRTRLQAASRRSIAKTITQYLDRNGASGWLRRLIEVAYTTEMGLECSEQSALNFLTFIDPGTETFKIFGESDERFHVRGGNDQIPQRLGAALGASVETGHVLEAIRQGADGSYTLSFKRGAGASEVRAKRACSRCRSRRCAACASTSSFRRSNAVRSTSFVYGTNAKLMIGFDERVWWTRHHLGGATYSDLKPQRRRGRRAACSPAMRAS